MRVTLKILFAALILTACTQSELIRKLPPERGGYLIYGGDNARSFYVPIAISDSLKLKWSFSTHGSYNSSSIVAYDKYMISHDLSGTLDCFDIETGKEIGAVKYNGSIYSAPVIYKSRMFFVVNNSEEEYSTAYYYDLEDSKILAETNMPGSFTNQLLKTDNAFYALSDQGVVYKYNFAGVNEWEFDCGVKTAFIPAMEGNKIVFAAATGEIVAFDCFEKRILLKKKISDGFGPGVVIAGKNVYTGDAKGIVYCVNIENGSVLWQCNTGYKVTSLPVYNDSLVYITSGAGVVSCIERKAGKLRWQTKTGGAPETTPVLFGNFLLQPNLDRYLYFINAQNGLIVKKQRFGGRMKMTPAFFNGLLFLGYDKGNIDAFEIKEAE